MEVKIEKFKKGIKDYFIATQPWSFTLSLISVSVGTLLAAEDGSILRGWYVCLGMEWNRLLPCDCKYLQ